MTVFVPDYLFKDVCIVISHVYVNGSVVSDSANSWTVAHQAPLSTEFCRQEYWSGLTFPSPGDTPNPGIEPGSLVLQADSLLSEPPGKPIFIHTFSGSFPL